jgi:hypothetical protein
VKKEDREKLESKITEKLLVALDDDPTASMLKTAIEWLTLTDSGRIKAPRTTEEDQQETLARLTERLAKAGKRLPFGVEEEPRPRREPP